MKIDQKVHFEILLEQMSFFCVPPRTIDTGACVRLQEACRKNDVQLARDLLAEGACVNYTSAQGSTLLHIAAERNSADCAQLLLLYCAKIKTTPLGIEPLHQACTNDSVDVAQLLIRYRRQSVSAKTTKEHGRWTALHLAVKYNSIKCVELLLENGADIEARAFSGARPIDVAAALGHASIVTLLLDAGADGSIHMNAKGWYPIHSAAHAGQHRVVALLLHKYPCTSKTTTPRAKLTSLHMSSQFGCLNCMHHLFTYGANINARNCNGDTPLHCAVINGRRAAAQFLLIRGADGTIVNSNRQTPLQIACEMRDVEMRNALLEHCTKTVDEPLLSALKVRCLVCGRKNQSPSARHSIGARKAHEQ